MPLLKKVASKKSGVKKKVASKNGVKIRVKNLGLFFDATFLKVEKP